jgi:hypothetical protein
MTTRLAEQPRRFWHIGELEQRIHHGNDERHD